MGARSTKVATPLHVKAAASPVASAQQHYRKSKLTDTTEPLPNHVHEAERGALNSSQPTDDINIKISVQTIPILRRRHSDPVQTGTMATELNRDGIRHVDAFNTFLAERDLMAIDIDHASPVSPVALNQIPALAELVTTQKESTTPQELAIACTGCCVELPGEGDPNHIQEVIRPCKPCNSAYCISCVRGMFLAACNDSTRMPPRCCLQIHLHHVRPYLTHEEITEFKSKYEEWSTPRPFYCPVPTCSAFISERFLPHQVHTKGKRQVDSGIGTPISTTFRCPRCESSICADCRQPAHPESLCASLELGIDTAIADLLDAWGYKRCPKCSQGLKRMFGCNHMQCRCGAHFCWGCMKSRDVCDGDCYEEEDDEDEESDFGPDEPEPRQATDDSTIPGSPMPRTEVTDAIIANGNPQADAGVATGMGTSSPESSRVHNLDGGSARYWRGQDIDFGEEPTNDVGDHIWQCHHSFTSYTIPLSEATSKHSSAHHMECVQCWCPIQPIIEPPQSPTSSTEPVKNVRAFAGRGRRGRRGRGRGMVGRLRPVSFVPPRGLIRSDATIGTAPHLTAQIPYATLRPVGGRSEPMEDVKEDMEAGRREEESAPDSQLTRKATTATSDVFRDINPAQSIAMMCRSCDLLVCQKCADDTLARRQTEGDIDEVERAAEEVGADQLAAAESREPVGHVDQTAPSLLG